METIQESAPLYKMITPLRHTQVIGGESGVSFQIGDSTLFLPYNDQRLFLIHPPAEELLLIGASLPEDVAAVLIHTVIEPRLLEMARDLEPLL